MGGPCNANAPTALQQRPSDDAGVDRYLERIRQANAAKPKWEQFDPGRPGKKWCRYHPDGSVRWVGADPYLSPANTSARSQLWPHGTFIRLQKGKKYRVPGWKGAPFLKAYRMYGQLGMILGPDLVVSDVDTHGPGEPDPPDDVSGLDILGITTAADSLTADTPSGGWHVYNLWPPDVPKPTTKIDVLDTGLDLFAEGAAICLPGVSLVEEPGRWPAGTYETVHPWTLREVPCELAFRRLLIERADEEYQALKNQLDDDERRAWRIKRVYEIDTMTDPERAERGPEPVKPVEQLRLDDVCLPAQARRRADGPSARSGRVYECLDWVLEERRKEARQRRQDAREARGLKPVAERARKSGHTRASGRFQVPTPDDPRFGVTRKGERSEAAWSLAKDYYRAGSDFDSFYAPVERSPLGVAMFAFRKLRGETARRWCEHHVWDRMVARVDSSRGASCRAGGLSPREVYGDPDAAAEMLAFLEHADLADDERLVGMLLATRAAHHGRTFYCSLAQMVTVLEEAGVTYDFVDHHGEHRMVRPNWRHAKATVESLQDKGALHIHDRDGLPDGQATYFTITAPKAVEQAVDPSLSSPPPVTTPLLNSSSEGVSPSNVDRLQADWGLYPGMPVRLLTDEELERVRSRSMFGLESDWWRYWRDAGRPEHATTASEALLAA